MINREAISARTSLGKVTGSGNPPENVITSVAPARARIAVISPPPSVCVRRATLASQLFGSIAVVIDITP